MNTESQETEAKIVTTEPAVPSAEGTTDQTVAQVSKPAVSQASKPADLDHANNAESKPTAPVSKRKHRPHPSKISNLPSDLREFVNESISKLTPYKTIIETLTEKGHPGISERNISKWKKSGYEHWLKERERLQCMQMKVHDVGRYFRQFEDNGENYANRLNEIFVDIQLNQAFLDFDPDLLAAEMRKDPQFFFKFVRATHTRSLDRQRDDRIKLEREKLGIEEETGPSEEARQAVKQMLNYPTAGSRRPNPKVLPTETRFSNLF